MPSADAVARGETILNALNGSNAVQAITGIGAASFAGKVVLDLALPLNLSHGFPPNLTVSGEDSLAERCRTGRLSSC